jgi:dTDP-4-dehydrorhamnose reductase
LGRAGKNYRDTADFFSICHLPGCSASGSERLTIIDNKQRAPTMSIAIADKTPMIVEAVLAGRFGVTKEWAGVQHITCCGVVSWCGFAQAILAHAGRLLNRRSPRVVPIPISEYPTSARRPLRCCEKLARGFEVRLHYWEAALNVVA